MESEGFAGIEESEGAVWSAGTVGTEGNYRIWRKL